jgi:hypothetical protein
LNGDDLKNQLKARSIGTTGIDYLLAEDWNCGEVLSELSLEYLIRAGFKKDQVARLTGRQLLAVMRSQACSLSADRSPSSATAEGSYDENHRRQSEEDQSVQYRIQLIQAHETHKAVLVSP